MSAFRPLSGRKRTLITPVTAPASPSPTARTVFCPHGSAGPMHAVDHVADLSGSVRRYPSGRIGVPLNGGRRGERPGQDPRGTGARFRPQCVTGRKSPPQSRGAALSDGPTLPSLSEAKSLDYLTCQAENSRTTVTIQLAARGD